MERIKKYTRTAGMYADKLRSRGYTVRFNWVDADMQQYEDVSVRGPLFCGYGGDFPTPREAWDYIRRNSN